MSDVLRQFSSSSYSGYDQQPPASHATSYTDNTYQPQSSFRQAQPILHNQGMSTSGQQLGLGQSKGGNIETKVREYANKSDIGRKLVKGHDQVKEGKYISKGLKSVGLDKYSKLAEKYGYGQKGGSRFQELHDQQGGSWSDFTGWVKNAAKKVYNTGKKVYGTLKDTKAISTIGRLVPHPGVQAFAKKAEEAGFGRHKGGARYQSAPQPFPVQGHVLANTGNVPTPMMGRGYQNYNLQSGAGLMQAPNQAMYGSYGVYTPPMSNTIAGRGKQRGGHVESYNGNIQTASYTNYEHGYPNNSLQTQVARGGSMNMVSGSQGSGICRF